MQALTVSALSLLVVAANALNTGDVTINTITDRTLTPGPVTITWTPKPGAQLPPSADLCVRAGRDEALDTVACFPVDPNTGSAPIQLPNIGVQDGIAFSLGGTNYSARTPYQPSADAPLLPPTEWVDASGVPGVAARKDGAEADDTDSEADSKSSRNVDDDEPSKPGKSTVADKDDKDSKDDNDAKDVKNDKDSQGKKGGKDAKKDLDDEDEDEDEDEPESATRRSVRSRSVETEDDEDDSAAAGLASVTFLAALPAALYALFN